MKKKNRNLIAMALILPLLFTSCSNNGDQRQPGGDNNPEPVNPDPVEPEPTGRDLTFDVVVYGGTCAGFISAIAAKRNGASSVAYISSTENLGGLTTSGLGATDMMNYKVIGGIAREFYQKIYTYYNTTSEAVWNAGQTRTQYFNDTNLAQGKIFYGKNDSTKMQWVFEPHVVKNIVSQMLMEAEVTVFTNNPIKLKNGVELNNDTKEITKINMVNGDTFSAKVFIDASYEGDLMAQAGVTYTVGREANEQYNEQFNGIYRNDDADTNKKSKDTSPYIVTGNEESGLLPFIEDAVPGENGAADSRVQAYTYRFTLTNNVNNKKQITKPDNYHPEWFETYGREYAVGKRTANPLTFNLMPNLKTDTNQADFVGASHDYPEADYEERARLEQMHKDYCLGFIYFLANDSRVPVDVRSQMNTWGLALDEFQDNDYFPYAIYLREGRRMVSDYVMTEMNVINESRKIDAPYSIGQGMYNCDSHWVSKFVNDTKTGFIGEGSYWESKRNYPISYQSICPKKGETTNLYVTCCLSATHAAYGSIRMEPVYMVIGESAGTAAAMIATSSSKVATQDLDYISLKDKLTANGQLLGTIVIPDDGGGDPQGEEIIVSINDAGFTEIGTLKSSSNYTYDGKPIKITNELNAGGRFTPETTLVKEHEVYVYNQFAGGNFDDGSYLVTINHNNANPDTVTFSASGNENKAFIKIGTYSDIANVEITKNIDSTKHIRLSAVKFVKKVEAQQNQMKNLERLRDTPAGYVDIPDVNLKKLLIKEVGSTNGEVTPEQMSALTEITTPDNDPVNMIKDLTGLEKATNLTKLDLSYNKVKSLEPIKNLTKLTYLDISYNPIKSLNGLEKLTSLNTLIAPGISNFSPELTAIGSLTNLTFLNLSVNRIKDISFLSGCKNLTKLYLSFNNINNISVLDSFNNLDTLAVDNNNLSTDIVNNLSTRGISHLYTDRQNTN